MKIRAPAKINLSLRVIGKRWDGYHLLDTVMVTVSLYDVIEICKLQIGTSQPPLAEAVSDVVVSGVWPGDARRRGWGGLSQ